jgi:hypothetical protein
MERRHNILVELLQVLATIIMLSQQVQ